MGKRNEDGSYECFDEQPAESSGGSSSDESEYLAIEEHAKQEKVQAHIFAAVKAMKGWNPGKKVHKSVFNEAVNAFLNAPIGGN